jgi:crotonobetainyl-CoA:carnitine CoA-transferase CaiB-like acyl-CoA transferase
MTLPLEGLRILDFTNFVTGQLPTLILAEMGADVIKIERPGIRENVYSITHGGKEPTPQWEDGWLLTTWSAVKRASPWI